MSAPRFMVCGARKLQNHQLILTHSQDFIPRGICWSYNAETCTGIIRITVPTARNRHASLFY